MRPLTDHLPKPMIELCGRPMIDYALDAAKDAGADTIVVNTHYKPEPLIDHLEGKPVHVVHEADQILDTGGGLKNTLGILGQGPVWTYNPDVVWSGPNPLTVAAQNWDADKMDALLVCVPVQATHGHVGHGDFTIDNEGRIERGAGYVYGGVQILKTQTLSSISETVFSLNTVWDWLIAQGLCFGCRYLGQWADVGCPENIAKAEALLSGGRHA